MEEYTAYTVRAEERKKNRELKSKDAEEQPVLLKIPFSALLERLAAVERVDDFRSPATEQTGTANKTTRLATFPKYLVIQLRKYVMGEDWVIKKLDVQIPFPEHLDLEFLRGKGQQEGEVPFSSESAAPEPEQFDAAVVTAVAQMGFSENAAKRGIKATNNGDLEAVINWIMEHMGDSDLNDPLPSSAASPKPSSGGASVNSESLGMLVAMGINEKHAKRALQETDGNVERAVEWCFSHPEEEEGAGQSKKPETDDGKGVFTLVAVISHSGASTFSGHYVCHIKKEGRWVIYNDNKVALSENPPLDRGYLALYRRADTL